MKKTLLLAQCLLLYSCNNAPFAEQQSITPSIAEIPRPPSLQEPPPLPSSPVLFKMQSYASSYDKFKLEFTLVTPKENNSKAPLIILLGSLKEYPENLRDLDINAWYLNIPSRPLMNYQLLAEGDFWHILEKVYEENSFLKYRHTYLVGKEKSADAALLFANNYRSHFSGVTFTGSRLAFNLPNLDNLPIVYYRGEEGAASSPWGGEHLIDKLQSRGNINASYVKDGFAAALQTMLGAHLLEKGIAPYTFTDYNEAQVSPWLKALAKRSEKDPATISARLEEGVLTIDAPNITAIELFPNKALGFPEGTTSIFFNDHAFPMDINARGSIELFEDRYYVKRQNKAHIPSGLINFYRNEPLLVIFQDEGADEEFLRKGKELARLLSHAEFFGFPDLQVNLPMLPLSLYNPNDFKKHRIIIIGEGTVITKKIPPLISTPDLDNSDKAFGLITPTKDDDGITLALFLSANDIEGMEILKQYYTSATSLFDDADFILWQKQENEYLISKKETLNSFWETSAPSQVLIETPHERNVVWEKYLQELVIENSSISRMAVTQFLDEYLTVPSRITFESLSQIIPEKHFALVTLHGYSARKIGCKLLAAMDAPQLHNLNDDVTLDPISNDYAFHIGRKGQKKRLRFIIDASALEELSTEELNMIDYKILPLSLREMVIDKIITHKEDFGRDFLRLANLIEE